MFSSQRTLTYFSADAPPDPAFVGKLPRVAGALANVLSPSNWQITPNNYVYRDEQAKFLFVASHRRFHFFTLGLEKWTDNLRTYQDIVERSFAAFDAASLERVGFKICTWMNLEMTFAEVANLFFGSCLAERKRLPPALRQVQDLFLHFEGSHEDFEYTFDVSPHTVDQARRTFAAAPNIKSFLRDPLDDLLIRTAQAMCVEGLYLDVDVFKKKQPLTSLGSFLNNSHRVARSIADSFLSHLRSVPE